MSLIGIAAMFLLLIIARPLVFQVLNVPKVLQKETIEAIRILAFSIPFVLLSTGFRGVLEAFQKFKEIAVIQSIIGTSTYVGIAFILDYSVKLPASVSFLMLLKIISMLAFGWLSTRKSRLFRSNLKIYKNELKTLFSFGGWVTVSNVINPIIYQLDRFMIGVVATMTSVTFYTTPFDLIQKINVIPSAIVGVLFPAFSTSFFKQKARADKLFTSGIQIVEIIILPITVFIFMFSREIMGIWLGEKFVAHSSLVLQIFAATIIFNNLARIPFSYLYGMARPDIAAKIHLFELPFVAVLLWPVIRHFGIIGAAILSGIRIVIDFFILLFFVRRLTGIHLALFKWFGVPIIVFVVSLTVVLVVNLVMIKMLCYLILMFIFYVYTWHYLISSEQRIKLKRQAQKIFQIT